MVNAVILSGRANQGGLSQERASQEALIDIAGKPMVLWVIESLQAAERIGKISVVAAPEVEQVVEYAGAHWVEAGASLVENVRRGAASLPRDEPILMVSGDIPLLQSRMVDDFLLQAEELHADVVYPIIDRRLCEDKYPLVKRTYVTLREGTFTGGNIVLLQLGALAPALRFLQKAYDARKKPWRLAAMLGWRFIWQLMTHQAQLSALEGRASSLLGLTARAARVTAPEIGIDVDKPDDLKLVRSALR